MKKKLLISIIVTLSVLIVFSVAYTLYITQGFTISRNTKHIYKPQNVYEEIWNLFVVEENGGETVLATGNSKAREGYDGYYIIQMDVSGSYSLVIKWDYSPKGLKFSFYYPVNNRSNDVIYTYEYETKTLYGWSDIDFFLEHFLNSYFEWCEESGNKSAFSADDRGEYTFQYSRPSYAE